MSFTAVRGRKIYPSLAGRSQKPESIFLNLADSRTDGQTDNLSIIHFVSVYFIRRARSNLITITLYLSLVFVARISVGHRSKNKSISKDLLEYDGHGFPPA